jgi:hypothetical protein
MHERARPEPAQTRPISPRSNGVAAGASQVAPGGPRCARSHLIPGDGNRCGRADIEPSLAQRKRDRLALDCAIQVPPPVAQRAGLPKFVLARSALRANGGGESVRPHECSLAVERPNTSRGARAPSAAVICLPANTMNGQRPSGREREPSPGPREPTSEPAAAGVTTRAWPIQSACAARRARI